MPAVGGSISGARKKIALLTVDCVDEWLDSLHLQMPDFAHTRCGGWFSTLQALAMAGYDVTLIGTSMRVKTITGFTNVPTQANVVILPANRVYRCLQRILAGRLGKRPLLRKLLAALMGYVSLPVSLLSPLLRRCAGDGLLVEQYGLERSDVAVLVAARLGIPVYGMSSAVFQESRLAPVRALRRFMMRYFTGFAICSSHEMKRLKEVCGVDASRLYPTIFPVDTGFWSPQNKARCRAVAGIPLQARVVIWHGGFDVRVKGLDTLITAWSMVMRRIAPADCRLLIIGNRYGAEVLRRMISDSGAVGVQLIDRWIHDRNEVRDHLGAADVYVFPSRNDAFGIAPLEAMACGLPAILSEAAGVAGLFSGAADGVITCAPDRSDEWANAIEKLLTDVALSASLGRNAVDAVARKASMPVGAQAFSMMLAH